MILISPEMQAALENCPAIQTVEIDMVQFPDLIAGQSVVMIENQWYGVLRYERLGGGQYARATLVPMPLLTT